MKLKRYRVRGDSKMTSNSGVDMPAVEIDFLAFNKKVEKEKLLLSSSDEKQMFMGVSILADVPIVQKRKDGTLIETVFYKDDIKQIVTNYIIDGKQHKFNYNHNKSKEIKGIYMVENFFLDKDRISSPLFDNVTDGSYITTYYVPDKMQYLELKNDPNFNGFSIEIDAVLEEIEYEKVQELSDFARDYYYFNDIKI